MKYILSGKVLESDCAFSLLDATIDDSPTDIVFKHIECSCYKQKELISNSVLISSNDIYFSKVYESSSAFYIWFEDSSTLFEITHDRKNVTCYYSMVSDLHRIELDFLLYAFVFLQVLEGMVPLHASCALLPNGECVAFIGPSGAGKSTLVQAMYQFENCKILSDDTVFISSNQGKFSVHPAYPIMKSAPSTTNMVKNLVSEKFLLWDNKQKYVYMLKHDPDTFYMCHPIRNFFILHSNCCKIEITSEESNAQRVLLLFSSMFAGYLIPKNRYYHVLSCLYNLVKSCQVYDLSYYKSVEALPTITHTIVKHICSPNQ